MSYTNDSNHSPRLRLAVAAAVLASAVVAFPVASAYEGNEGTKKTQQAVTKAVHPADSKFINSAINGSEKEITIARLALERATDARVRDMAGKLEQDHQSLLAQLQQTAVALGLPQSSSSSVAASGSAAGVKDDLAPGVVSGSGATTAGTMASGAGGYSSAGSSSTAVGTAGSAAGGMSTTSHSKDPEVVALSQKSGAEFDRAVVNRLIVDHEHSVELFSKASADSKIDPRVRTLAEQSLPTLRGHLAMARALRADLEKNAAK